MAFHILTAHQNVVEWWLVLNYMRTPLTYYFLESSWKLILSSALVSLQFWTSKQLSQVCPWECGNLLIPCYAQQFI